MFDTNTIYDELREARTRVVRDPVIGKQVEKLRDQLIDGLADRIVIPEVSTDNGLIAHELLGCPLYNALIHTLWCSYELPQTARVGVHSMVIEAVTGMSIRLISEGADALKRLYGDEHLEDTDYAPQEDYDDE